MMISPRRSLTLVILGLPCALLLAYPIEMMLGYYPGYPAWKVAEEAAALHDVTLCKKIIAPPWGMYLGTPLGESRISCVMEYAKIAKDPAVCERLMPSSYGLDCVGGAISSDNFCHFYNSDPYVYWDEAGDAFDKAKIKSCQKNDLTKSAHRNQCCLIARVRYVKTENDCSSLKENEELHNECLNYLAIKNSEPSVCEGITDENLKLACSIRTKAMKENPSICQGCTKAVESLSDLK